MASKSAFSKTVGYALLHAARLHRARMAQLLQELGLFPGQEQVLTVLADGKGRTMGDLVGLLRVRPPTVSKMVARLTLQGLVERRADAGDARLVLVWITDEGRKRAAAVESVWRVLEMETVEGLDGKDRKRLRQMLRRIAKQLAQATGSGDADAAGGDAEDPPPG